MTISSRNIPAFRRLIRTKGDFRNPKIRRARFSNYRTGLSQEVMYNPTKIKENKGANLIITPIPGLADPMVDWASGKVSSIAMKLRFDGEIRLHRRGQPGAQLLNGAKGIAEIPLDRAGETYSIAGEIEFFEQFDFPVQQGMASGQRGEPDLLVFTWGRRYQGVLCQMQNLSIDIYEWSPAGDPVKAELTFALVRKVLTSRWSHDVWDVPQGIGLASQRIV